MVLLSALLGLSEPCSSRQAARLLRCIHSTSVCHLTSENGSQVAQLEEPVAYLSESTDPYFNLSYEDWLLRNTPRQQPTLFLYRNTPSVVIGRNQTPWKETTPRLLAEQSIQLVRRRSGGGTVFHDMGNTNFAIILPRESFTRRHGAELVARAVRDRLDIEACDVNERNDVIIRAGSRELKVSGSAYKIIQHRAYHHGTMLISSSLDELGQALHSNSPDMVTSGIPSFRSPVTNLNSHLPAGAPTVTHERFVEAVTDQFADTYAQSRPMDVRVVRSDEITESKVLEGAEELKSWEWTYGQTPQFTNRLETTLSVGPVIAEITARKALITELKLKSDASQETGSGQGETIQAALDTIAAYLIGKRYADFEDNVMDESHNDTSSQRVKGEVINWLRAAA